jgi:hypothetical protein
MTAQALTGLVFHAEYRDIEPIRTAWIGNDWITLCLAVPLLLISGVQAGSGSTRAMLVWLGMIGYAFYNYAFYVFGAALSPFFLLHVIAFVAAGAALILALPRLDVVETARRFGPGTPVRFIAGTLVVIGAGLATAWILMWARYAFGGRSAPVAPEAFKVVAALDLSLMVPALTIGGMLLWRREPWGFLISAIASIQGALYLIVLSFNSLVAIRRGLATAPGELPIWGFLTLLMTMIAVGLLINIRDDCVPDHELIDPTAKRRLIGVDSSPAAHQTSERPGSRQP